MCMAMNLGFFLLNFKNVWASNIQAIAMIELPVTNEDVSR